MYLNENDCKLMQNKFPSKLFENISLFDGKEIFRLSVSTEIEKNLLEIDENFERLKVDITLEEFPKPG